MLLRCWILACLAAIAPAQTLTTLVNFNGTNGDGPPTGGLVQATDGNFYGTTSYDGANGEGTIFKITPGGKLTTLYSFNGVSDGAAPNAGMIQGSDGNFYGTTVEGGSGGDGTVFKITPGGTLTTLHNFDGTNGATVRGDGSGPIAGLIQATDGSFYGTTKGGGAKNAGTIFKITPAGVLTTLYSFTEGSDGGAPYGGLVQASDGNFYGTTESGGADNLGTVFKITPDGTLTTLHTFGTTSMDGGLVYSGLIQATDGNLYGTTASGAHAGGTIFRITTAGTLTTLYVFSGPDGQAPFAGLIQDRDGNLYGTTFGGGANNDGTVFELQLPSATPAITLAQNAEGGASTIAPNTWVTLKGSNLAPAGDSRIWQASDFVNNQLPTQLDGVAVTLNGEKAFVYYISPTQINILTPPDLAAGPVQVQVATNAGTSASFAAQAQAESPSFFIFGGGPYVAATHSSGTLIGPTSLYPGQTAPAQPGETIVLYANGFGPISPAVVSGAEVQSGSLNPLPVIGIGGIPATVQFAGLISPGLFQFNVVVPASAPSGDNALTATYGGLTTQSGVLVTVGQ